MAGSRHRLGTPFAIAVDCGIAACLVLMWTTSLATLWLHVGYICVALSAFVRPSARATIGRATLVSALGGADLVRLHAHGEVPADDIVEIPLMTALSYCFALFVWQRRRAQREIEDDRERLGRMIDGMPLAIVVFDGAGRIASWNRTAESLFGWRADEVIGADNPIVPASERAASDRLLREMREGRQLQGMEVERVARDGTTLELAVYSAPLGASSTVVLYADVRDQRRAQAERDEALASYQELVESLPLVTYVDEVDDLASNVYTSPQVEQLLGWPVEEWARNPQLFVEILHPEDHDRVMNAVHEANTTRLQFEDEYRLRHRDGHYVWVRDCSSILDDRGPRPFARGFLLDITEQKRLEEQLLQAQKMDAVGQFAGGIAHDFNNLLTGISGYAELAAGAGSTDPLLVRSLQGIRAASAEAASLTAQLLTFSRRDVPERRLVDVSGVLREAAEFLDRLVRADVRVELALADELPPVSADATQLKQVVLNLALNARDAMPDGGTLTLEAAADGESIAIRVRDTGHGMDEATRARAFEPFFTTKPEGEGTGLGLAVAYGVVDALRGTLALRSSPGMGTLAEIVLPAAVGAAEELAVEAHVDKLATGPARVLVVEDRDVVRDLAREVLGNAGFDVAVASGGHDALALVSDAARFDLLLSDVVMPEMSGPELARRLREEQPGLPVLYMSGYTDDVLHESELAHPRTGFIRKPFTNGGLIGAVTDTLGYPWAAAARANASSPSSASAG